MAENEGQQQHATANGTSNRIGDRKYILLNAFDMSTVGHLSPGQWKVSQLPINQQVHSLY